MFYIETKSPLIFKGADTLVNYPLPTRSIPSEIIILHIYMFVFGTSLYLRNWFPFSVFEFRVIDALCEPIVTHHNVPRSSLLTAHKVNLNAATLALHRTFVLLTPSDHFTFRISRRHLSKKIVRLN